MAVIYMVDPNDLLSTRFEKKRGGYKAVEVDSFLVEATTLISQQKREIAELKRRLDSAQVKISEYEKDQDSIKEALLSAQKLADSTVREARAKAEQTEREAAARANSLIGGIRSEITAEKEKLAQMKREVAAFRSKLMNIYRTHIEMINDLPAFREEEAQPEQEEQNMPATPAEEPAVAGVQPEEAPMQMAMDEAAAAQAFETSAGDDGPAAGESNRPDEGAPDVKLNVRFDEESGEYLPMADNGRRHR